MPRARARFLALLLIILPGMAGCGSDDGDGQPPEDGPSGGVDAGTPPDGSGPGPGDPDAGPPPDAIVLPPVEGPVVISEVMYHPVLEEDFIDWHEFVEIHNPSPDTVSLTGWKLEGGIAYMFPDGTEIAAGAYLVVARNRPSLLAVYPGVNEAAVLGDYQGELDNGGDPIVLRKADGEASDALEYDDDAPWPVAADGLGAGENWLKPELQPEEAHRYLGYSMERVSFSFPATEAANWVVSALDAPTPGSANSGARAVPHVVARAHGVSPASGQAGPVRGGEEALMRVQMSAVGAIDSAEVEYFVDDVTRTGEPVSAVALYDDGTSGDATAGDRLYTGTLPAQAERSIVRYRVRVTAEGAERVASPRPDDPFEWHAYYVSPVIASQAPVYELFIDPDAWTTMYQNVDNGRVNGCAIRPEWNDKLPAVFVHNGHVYDVRVRYQGSRFNRINPDRAVINDWPFPGPDVPDPLAVLSWRIQFPRYDRFSKRRVVIVNKFTSSCPGLAAGVGMQLFAEAGLPAPKARYVRFYVNGGYYRYAMDYERPGEDMLERYFDELVDRGEWPAGYEIGHLFKSRGCNCDEGPYSYGDGRLIGASCGYTAAERYAETYARKTHEWLGHEELIALIQGMHTARAQGPVALRAYLEEKFDVDAALTYIAIMNWSVPYDDMYQNFFLYQRREDLKWMILPWDLDRNFGDWKGEQQMGPASSIFVGALGNPDNGNDQANYFKDSLLRSFTAEYRQKLDELNQTLLRPEHINPMVDAFYAGGVVPEAQAALSPISCYQFAQSQGDDEFKAFTSARNTHVGNVVFNEVLNLLP
jgi:CotH kinase protein/Lamin Tail Domain